MLKRAENLFGIQVGHLTGINIQLFQNFWIEHTPKFLCVLLCIKQKISNFNECRLFLN